MLLDFNQLAGELTAVWVPDERHEACAISCAQEPPLSKLYVCIVVNFRAFAPIHLAARVRPEACLILPDLPPGALATAFGPVRCCVSVLLGLAAPFVGAAVSPFAESAGAKPPDSLALL